MSDNHHNDPEEDPSELDRRGLIRGLKNGCAFMALFYGSATVGLGALKNPDLLSTPLDPETLKKSATDPWLLLPGVPTALTTAGWLIARGAVKRIDMEERLREIERARKNRDPNKPRPSVPSVPLRRDRRPDGYDR